MIKRREIKAESMLLFFIGFVALLVALNIVSIIIDFNNKTYLSPRINNKESGVFSYYLILSILFLLIALFIYKVNES